MKEIVGDEMEPSLLNTILLSFSVFGKGLYNQLHVDYKITNIL